MSNSLQLNFFTQNISYIMAQHFVLQVYFEDLDLIFMIGIDIAMQIVALLFSLKIINLYFIS